MGVANEVSRGKRNVVEEKKADSQNTLAEKRSWIKNKLKWLEKEPRAAFFYFFYLGAVLEKARANSIAPRNEHEANPLSARALGIRPLNLAIAPLAGVQKSEEKVKLGGLMPEFNFNDPQEKHESGAPDLPEASEEIEKNSLLQSFPDMEKKPEKDLDELLKGFAGSTLKDKPARGVSFPSFSQRVMGMENIPECIINTLSEFNLRNVGEFIKEVGKAWTKAQEDFQQAFSWMDIKNKEQCIWVWNTMKEKGVSPPLNPLNNFQRWHFICATFDLWQGWTNDQIDELTKNQKKISPQRLDLKISSCEPRKHKAVLMDELEKAWALKLFRKKEKERKAELKIPAKIKKKLTRLSVMHGISESDILVALIESEYARNHL